MEVSKSPGWGGGGFLLLKWVTFLCSAHAFSPAASGSGMLYNLGAMMYPGACDKNTARSTSRIYRLWIPVRGWTCAVKRTFEDDLRTTEDGHT
ncbi:uncharacterized protein P884DRAFT_254581 [Thermothelomyces heterothallicus CBS 202.75]|uniref:uncharacterized protein n=1 Tax=Thermothelomyces heterothallicus CBS 202.75 TaxID=1149848 RepID=UPI0037428345